MGTSWISRKGGILEKDGGGEWGGGGCDLEKEGYQPLYQLWYNALGIRHTTHVFDMVCTGMCISCFSHPGLENNENVNLLALRPQSVESMVIAHFTYLFRYTKTK